MTRRRFHTSWLIAPFALLAGCGEVHAPIPPPPPDLGPALPMRSCSRNQRVRGGLCVYCPRGMVNDAGDDADGEDTTCDPLLCGEDEVVYRWTCARCLSGQSNRAGDDARFEETECDGARCASDERVQSGTCVPCEPGSTRPAGDDPDGPDTACGDSCEAVFGVGCEVFADAYLKPSAHPTVSAAARHFGASVALDGDTLAVGLPLDGVLGAGTGVVETDASRGPVESGAVYVFRRVEGRWTREAYIKASNPDASDGFGTALALDGDTLVVGAAGEDSAGAGVDADELDNSSRSAGAAYVFVREGGVWGQVAYLKPADPEAYAHFGSSVAIDGDRIVVAAPGVRGWDRARSVSGRVYVFRRDPSGWVQEARLTGAYPGDTFGRSVALSGTTLAVGAPSFGLQLDEYFSFDPGGPEPDHRASPVFVFERTGDGWSLPERVLAVDGDAWDAFGESLDLEGDVLVVGAPSERSVARGVDGDPTDDGAYQRGAAYVFTRAAVGWVQRGYLKPLSGGDGARFGADVAVSGGWVAVGAPDASTHMAGLRTPLDDYDPVDSGVVFLFAYDVVGPSLRAVMAIAPGSPDSGDQFGRRLALGGDVLAIGALMEASAATGVDGDEEDDSQAGTGAVFVRRLAP